METFTKPEQEFVEACATLVGKYFGKELARYWRVFFSLSERRPHAFPASCGWHMFDPPGSNLDAVAATSAAPCKPSPGKLVNIHRSRSHAWEQP